MLGLTVNGVATTIQTNVAGTTAAQFRQRGNEYPIVVRLREQDRELIQDIGDVLVNTPNGQVVPARNLLAVDRETGPVQIDRKNMERIVRVNAEPEVALSDAVVNVQERLGQIRVPQDFSVGFGSEVEEQAKSFNQLKIVLILAVLLVYAVMASQYESLRDPFIIMFSIPTASIGIVGGLLLTRTAFSMQAYIGVIMLAGIVVSNAILLVDYINTLRRRDGMPLREAVEVGGRTRLRPVLMTSIATMLGLVPMAIGIGDGGELQAPLARVVIGGLLASTLVTLVLVPAVYTLFEKAGRDCSTSIATSRQSSTSKSSRIVFPVTGSIQSGAISASGASTNRRSRNRGCGTVKPSASITLSPYRIRSRSIVRGAPPYGRSRPNCCSTESKASRAPRAERSDSPVAAAFKNIGCAPGTSTGTVS
jgi:HAE1 family hydrophobic/amphiphilic exporter-1